MLRAILLLLLNASFCYAQIDGPELVSLAEPIKLTVAVDAKQENVAYEWELDENSGFVETEGGIYVWSRPGKHTAEVVVSYVEDGKQKPTLKRYKFKYEVSDTFVPTPPRTETNLSTLVPLVDRSKVAETLNALAKNAKQFDSLKMFEAISAEVLPELVAKEINERVKTLDSIEAELKRAAKELGVDTPTPPPITTKPATLVVVAESRNQTPEIATLRARLMVKGPLRDYVKQNNIKTFWLDPETLEGDNTHPLVEKLRGLNPVPELYLLDSDGNIIGNLDLTENTTATEVLNYVSK